MIPIANPVISEEAKKAVAEVLDSGMIADGEIVRQFENEFAEYVGVDHAVATSSGTTALHTMLEAAGIGKGDVVLTSPFSFIASANAVVHAGATPVFADVRRDTYNLDPESTRQVIEEQGNVTAIMPVHLYGLPADMSAFREIADEYDLKLFEDAAQAHGAEYKGRKTGSLGDAAAFSFYPTKNMTTGEGGMITTDDEQLAARARQLINHGRTGKYEHEFVGYNYRMTNIQAAIGRDQLKRLPKWVEKRRRNASLLTDKISDTGLQTPTVPGGRKHSYHQYTVRTRDRELLVDAVENYGIGYSVHYPKTIPDQPAYRQSENTRNLDTARNLTDQVLSLPIHPHVSPDDVNVINRAVQEALNT